MKLTVDIDISRDDAKAFLKYMETLDFINIDNDSTDWWEQLTANEKQLIQTGANEIKQGKGIKHSPRKNDNLLNS